MVYVCWFEPGHDKAPVAAGYVVVDDALDVLEVVVEEVVLLFEGPVNVEFTA